MSELGKEPRAAHCRDDSGPPDGTIASQQSEVRTIGVDDVEEFVRELFSTERLLPIVVTTTRHGKRSELINPKELARRLAASARVVRMETGEATWAFGASVPEMLEVYGGAARIYWPGLTRASDPRDHPLMFVQTAQLAAKVSNKIVAMVLRSDAPARPDPIPETPPAAPGAVSAPPSAEPKKAADGFPGPSSKNRKNRVVQQAVVTELGPSKILIRAGNVNGRLLYADEKLSVIAARLEIGQRIDVFRSGQSIRGIPSFSIQGLAGSGKERTDRPAEMREQATPGQRLAARPARMVEQAVVTELGPGRIIIRAGTVTGRVASADERLAVVADQLHVGQPLDVFRNGQDAAGVPLYSIQGLWKAQKAAAALPAQRPVPALKPPKTVKPMRVFDLWPRIDEFFAEGQVVRGRICRVEEKRVLAEILPGLALVIPMGEIDWSFVEDARDFLSVGQDVAVEILSLDPRNRRGLLSIKRAYGNQVSDPVVVEPGQPPFLGDWNPNVTAGSGDATRLARELEILREELEAVQEDRRVLLERFDATSKSLIETRKELRKVEGKNRALEQRAGMDDPLASEVAFLSAVRVEYARMFNEGDRFVFPLQRMRVGPAFLDRLRNLDGVSVEKVVEVCAQVACNRAHLIPGRAVHELRSGEGGAPARTRKEDNAKAWRCSLQDGTASARRLHWWVVPGMDSAVTEFASVGVHDDLSLG